MKNNLKPCPLCGSTNLISGAFSISPDCYISCEDCGLILEKSVPWEDMNEYEHDKKCFEVLSHEWNIRKPICDIVDDVIEKLEEYKCKFVSTGVYEQTKWERDIAIEQLRELGYGLGEKVGWIPCSERLPKESLNSVLGWDEYRERCCFVQYYGGRWKIGNDEAVKIIAWMPLPKPYQPKESSNHE